MWPDAFIHDVTIHFLSIFPSVFPSFFGSFFLYLFFGGPHSICPWSYVQKPYRTSKWDISHMNATRSAWMGHVPYEHFMFSHSMSFRRRDWKLALEHRTTTTHKHTHVHTRTYTHTRTQTQTQALEHRTTTTHTHTHIHTHTHTQAQAHTLTHTAVSHSGGATESRR